MNKLDGKTAFIQGSTSGIGEACARRFAEAGAKVIVSGRNIEAGNRIVNKHSYNAGQSYFYAASKSAIIKITKLLAKRYGHDYRINAICPGVIRTPIFKNFDEERYIKEIPIGRVGEPIDVAYAANFLVSEDASFINGAILTIDGGQSL